ncbi:MAG TPA: glucosyl-3-phosphoglycerate synthase [Acidimicrobiia bacterium]|nr:glucosyl-3-phosphoglycerate synthase [Acidimicrobiia bacterium]
MPADPALAALVAAKDALGVTVSVCLPARNEEATVGQIVSTVRRNLLQRVGLVDEVVVMDDGSTDATAEAAAYDGARVAAVDGVLPGLTPGSGKGNALWLSLYECTGDIICWVDADIRNFAPHFVTRLLAPLLTDPAVGFVKGFYRRPLFDKVTGGGRVTELMARPVISALFPHLADFVQPLAGEYAGRRTLLESVPFVEGYGVEIGLLVDLVARYGPGAMAQADLGVREHRNRPLDELGPQAMAVLVTGLRRAGVPVDRRLAELVRYDAHQHQERVPVEIRERPPMISIPAYREKFGRAEDDHELAV